QHLPLRHLRADAPRHRGPLQGRQGQGVGGHPMATSWPKKRRIIGTKVQRLDGPDKATGKAKYSYAINRPGLLYGAILRGPRARAKIKSLDPSAALKMPGVKALFAIGTSFGGTVVKVDPAGSSLTLRIGVGKKARDVPVKVGR